MKILRLALGLYFAWHFTKGLEILLRSSSVDRILFDTAGLSWLFWPLMLLVLLADLVCVLYLARLDPAIFAPALAGVALGFLQTALASGIGFFKPGLMKEAVIASREARGLPIRQELLALLDNPTASLMPAVASGIFTIILIVLLILVKRHADKSQRHGLAAGARGGT